MKMVDVNAAFAREAKHVNSSIVSMRNSNSSIWLNSQHKEKTTAYCKTLFAHMIKTV